MRARLLLCLLLPWSAGSCAAAHPSCGDAGPAREPDAGPGDPDAGPDARTDRAFFEREVVFFGLEHPASSSRCERDWCIASVPGQVSTHGVNSVLLSVDPDVFEVELTVLDDDAGYWEARLGSPRETLADTRPEFWLHVFELRLSPDAPPDLPPARLRIAVQRVGSEHAPTVTEVFLETHAP